MQWDIVNGMEITTRGVLATTGLTILILRQVPSLSLLYLLFPQFWLKQIYAFTVLNSQNFMYKIFTMCNNTYLIYLYVSQAVLRCFLFSFLRFFFMHRP